MRSGICPKCQHAEVFMRDGWGHRTVLSCWFRTLILNEYICARCGYTESYLPQEQVQAVRPWLERWWRRVGVEKSA